jgi:ABC-type maltose transport system permease subunit
MLEINRLFVPRALKLAALVDGLDYWVLIFVHVCVLRMSAPMLLLGSL